MSGHNYQHYGVPDSTVTFGERFMCEGSSGGPRLTIMSDGSVTVSVAVDCDTDVRIVSHQVRLGLGDLTFKWPDGTEAEVHIESDPGRAYVAFWYVKFYNVICEWLDQPMMYVGYNAIVRDGTYEHLADGSSRWRDQDWLAIHDDLITRCQAWNAPGTVMVQLGLDRDRLLLATTPVVKR